MENEEQGKQRDRKFVEFVPPPPSQQRAMRAAAEPADQASTPPADVDMGPLEPLLGLWKGKGMGWNMIALPFENSPPSPAGFKFRVLMNQYDEELMFTLVDEKVPNRGLHRPGKNGFDQFVVTLDYQQKIWQTIAEDRPVSGDAGDPGLPIHHEPGLWLYMKNLKAHDTEGIIDVARLASIPHGSSVQALGHHAYHRGMPEIPRTNGLPSGRFEELASPDYDFKSDPYLEPFKHYIDNPFMGNVTGVPGFPGFNPADMNELLRFANQGVDIVKTTTLKVDSTRESGGIINAPFSLRESEAASMKSTFWIQELREKDEKGNPKLRLQYSQVVMLSFFRPREDELPGSAVWPHISINTLEKQPEGYCYVAAPDDR